MIGGLVRLFSIAGAHCLLMSSEFADTASSIDSAREGSNYSLFENISYFVPGIDGAGRSTMCCSGRGGILRSAVQALHRQFP